MTNTVHQLYNNHKYSALHAFTKLSVCHNLTYSIFLFPAQVQQQGVAKKQVSVETENE